MKISDENWQLDISTLQHFEINTNISVTNLNIKIRYA